MFTPKTIEAHATQPSVKMKPNFASFQQVVHSMDQVVKTGKRKARSISGSPTKNAENFLKNLKRKPFWQLAPDGKTIERIHTGEEPLEIDTPDED